jgi:hypothetical protein
MMKAQPPSRSAPQFVVRLPTGMREQINEAAIENNRSMNAEIVARLQNTFAGSSDLMTLSTGALIDELVNRLGARIQIVVAPEAAAAAGIAPSAPE